MGMTKELAVTAGLRYYDGVGDVALLPGVSHVDVASNIYSSGTVDLSSSREAIPMGEVSSPGYAIFENLGDNDLSLANDLTSSAYTVLKKGQSAMLPMGSATPHGWSTSGSKLRFLIFSV